MIEWQSFVNAIIAGLVFVFIVSLTSAVVTYFLRQLIREYFIWKKQ